MAAARCRTTGDATAASLRTLGRPAPEELMNNIWFDTCVYHQKGVETLVEVMGADNVVFASEMIGAVRGIDDRTGRYFDDTKPYVDALDLSESDASTRSSRATP